MQIAEPSNKALNAIKAGKVKKKNGKERDVGHKTMPKCPDKARYKANRKTNN